MAKTILCYGDSNTWGYAPATGQRYPREDRWVGVLQDELGEEYLVIPEGLNGRTTVFDDPVEGLHKNGMRTIQAIVESHKPLDLVVIMLGSNDLKTRFSAQSSDIAKGAGRLVQVVCTSATGPNDSAPQVLLISPPVILEHEAFGDMFEGGPEKSERFAECYAEIAAQHGCHFLNAASVVSSSEEDGIHLDPSEHLKLGTVVAEKVRSIFGDVEEED